MCGCEYASSINAWDWECKSFQIWSLFIHRNLNLRRLCGVQKAERRSTPWTVMRKMLLMMTAWMKMILKVQHHKNFIFPSDKYIP